MSEHSKKYIPDKEKKRFKNSSKEREKYPEKSLGNPDGVDKRGRFLGAGVKLKRNIRVKSVSKKLPSNAEDNMQGN